MSAGPRTRGARPAQYRSARSDGSSRASAEQYTSRSPDPTGSPAARSSPAKLASRPVNGSSDTGRDVLQVVADHVKVVPVLDDGSEGVLRAGGIEVARAQEVQGARPVDGLRHPGRFGQVQLAQAVYGGDDLTGQRRGDPGLAELDDLRLPFGRRVADPVVEA